MATYEMKTTPWIGPMIGTPPWAPAWGSAATIHLKYIAMSNPAQEMASAMATVRNAVRVFTAATVPA